MMKMGIAVLFASAAALVVVVVHDWYALHYGVVTVNCQWLPDTCVTIAPRGPANHMTAAATGKHVLLLVHRRAREGWFIGLSDSLVSDHFSLELDSMREGQTYQIPLECSVYHYRFLPMRGPTRSSPGTSPTGTITVVRVLDDRVRARFDLGVGPYDFMDSGIRLAQEKDFIRCTDKHAIYVAFAQESKGEQEP